MAFDIVDKIALITGGARDIGRAITLELARNGAHTVINYHESDAEAAATQQEVEALGRRALRVRADVRKKADVQRLVTEALRFGNGRIDILVNNAGGLIKRVSLADLTEELLDDSIRTNFTSTLLVCQAVIPQMAERGQGRVINIASLAAHNGGSVTTPHYGPAKAAVANLSRTLTKEFASKGITINTVSPGLIDNTFHRVHTSAEAFDAAVRSIPMGRPGTNEEVAAAVAFLASPAASYICGDVLHVNGGAYFGQ